MSKIIHEKLSNGIRVLLDPDSPAGTLAIGMAFTIGSVYERAEENGISHMLEHNIFCGTDEHSASQLNERAADMGAQFNAYTSKDITNYYMLGATREAGGMTDLLCDIVTRSIFPEEKFDLEKKAIFEEIKMRDDSPETALYQAMISNVYPDQSFGWDVGGSIENVSAISREKMMAYFKENYNADTMIVTVAGEMDPNSILTQLEKRLHTVPSGIQRIRPTTAFGEAAYTHVQRDQMNQSMMEICFAGKSALHEDYPALIVGSQILGGMEGKLLEELRMKRGLVYSAHSYASGSYDTGTMNIGLSCSLENVEESLDIVKNTLREFAGSITEEQLQRAKMQFLTSSAFSRETVYGRMNTNLNHVVMHGTGSQPQEKVEKIAALTLSDIKRAIEQTFMQKPFMATLGAQEQSGLYSKFTL